MVSDTGILVNKFSISKDPYEQFIGIKVIFKVGDKGVGAIYGIVIIVVCGERIGISDRASLKRKEFSGKIGLMDLR